MTKELAISLAVSALMTAPTSAASRTDQEKMLRRGQKGPKRLRYKIPLLPCQGQAGRTKRRMGLRPQGIV